MQDTASFVPQVENVACDAYIIDGRQRQRNGTESSIGAMYCIDGDGMGCESIRQVPMVPDGLAAALDGITLKRF